MSKYDVDKALEDLFHNDHELERYQRGINKKNLEMIKTVLDVIKKLADIQTEHTKVLQSMNKRAW